MWRRWRAGAAVVAVLAAVSGLVSCSAGASNPPGAPLTVGLTYTPDIQFAPFYVAEEKGYYAEAGLSVRLRHHGGSEDLFGALRSGEEDLVYAGGDEMVQARSRDVPVRNVATLVSRYPATLLVPADSPIHRVDDLRGRTIGTPGPYGENYFGLLALLNEAGLTERDTHVRHIGFTQQAALTSGQVDAVMGFVNNEAVAFNRMGKPVRPLATERDPLPLVSSGLGGLESTLAKRPELVRKFVAATLRGLRDTVEHPDEAVELAAEHVPTLHGSAKRADALAVLRATIPLFTATESPGRNDAEQWSRMAGFMHRTDLIQRPVDAAEAQTNEFLPATG